MAQLKHLQDAGVCHRDVKPGNFLVDGEGLLHLSDFDSCVFMEGDSSPAGGFTPFYAAPEVLNDVLTSEFWTEAGRAPTSDM